ncbi:hypothetical protein GCM10023189_49350 [Nibrella saemangeumensis]|uniref:NIPSNAP protein n=1 Tax=Nibrella saemangeumensis TaxID=1084526 RepID=A0ABP8NJ81_9BACT
MNARFFFRAVSIWALSLMLVTLSYAQNPAPQRQYSEVMYHKLKPGHTLQEALAIEDEWKKIHQVQVDNGHLTGWYVITKAITSNPNQTAYDYITIKNFSDFGVFGNGYPQSHLEKVFGSSAKDKWEGLGKRTEAVKESVKMEIWEGVDAAWNEKQLPPDKSSIWVIDWMRVKDGKYAEYVALEQDMKKLHQERIKMNIITGWNLSALKYPAGSENGYDYATVNYYGSTKELGDGRYAEAFQKAMPGQDAKKLTDRIYQTRDLVRQEICVLRNFAVKQPSLAAK